MKSLANKYIEEFPKDSLVELKSLNFKDWILESHEIAKDFIYKNIEYNGTPTEAYLDESYKIIKRRIVLGGYRLAEIVKSIKYTFDISRREGQINKKQESLEFLGIQE